MPTALVIAIAASMLVAILPSAAKTIRGKSSEDKQDNTD